MASTGMKITGLAARFHLKTLPIWRGSAISATFVARLIKGCRGDVRADRSRQG
jgi:hypothetical protein